MLLDLFINFSSSHFSRVLFGPFLMLFFCSLIGRRDRVLKINQNSWGNIVVVDMFFVHVLG